MTEIIPSSPSFLTEKGDINQDLVERLRMTEAQIAEEKIRAQMKREEPKTQAGKEKREILTSLIEERNEQHGP